MTDVVAVEPAGVTQVMRRRDLPAAAVAFRAVHAAIAVAFLLAIAEVWWSALTGRRVLALRPAVIALAGEGVLVAAHRGDYPLGGLQERLGHHVPLFELVLSPRAPVAPSRSWAPLAPAASPWRRCAVPRHTR